MVIQKERTICPICKKQTVFSPGYSPFCSYQCQSVDLGLWLLEEYKIPVEHVESVNTNDDESDEIPNT